jgi:hypothetical protein
MTSRLQSAPPLTATGRVRRRPPPRLSTVALLPAGALALVLATDLADFAGSGPRHAALDAAAEWSWSHVAAAVAMAAATAAGVAGTVRLGPHPRRWTLCAGAFGLLLADGVSRLHTHLPGGALAAAPLVLLAAVSAWGLAAGTVHAGAVAAGLATLAASFAVHVAGPHVVHALGWSEGSWAFELKVGLKEGLELAGWALVVPALWRVLADTTSPR